jgi:ribose transport system ATP-binding protein
MIAIARALETSDGTLEPSLLVLDEPTASLPEHEVDILLEALRRYSRAGYSILYVSHRLEEVLALSDEITVLRNGEHIITRPTAGLRHAELVEHIVGRPLDRLFAEAEQPAAGDIIFEAHDLAGGPLRGVTLDVRAGEIVGIAGLLGSGRTELLRTVFGAYRNDSGQMRIKGDSYSPKAPRDAMAAGVAYIPEQRDVDAAFPDLSVRENLSVGQLRRYWGRAGFRHRQERDDAHSSVDEFAVRTAGIEANLSSLSGGNQQKVILARWLRRDPCLLLLDEPTQGVDVGARADVYRSVRAAVSEGAGALLVSSDFEELAHASDRVLVLREGRIAAEVTGPELTAHRLNELVLNERLHAS